MDVFDDSGGGPRHDMTAEFVADLQRALEVELCALAPGFCGRHAERLGRGVDIEPGLAALDAGTDHREADAVASDRGAISDGCAVVAAGDAQAMQLPLRRRREADDFADIGDYSGKH